MYPVYILTYRNNRPSYVSMVILFFLSVRFKTDHIRMKLGTRKAKLMCSRNPVLILFMHKLNIVFRRRQRQTLDGYFKVNNKNNFKF